MGEVLHLFQAMAHGEPVCEFAEVSAVEDRGFHDCIHGRPGSRRQVLLMDFETLADFGILPGSVKENITTRGISLAELAAGLEYPRLAKRRPITARHARAAQWSAAPGCDGLLGSRDLW